MPKVVILDDQATDRQILERLARNVSQDVEVEAFACPREALAWFAENQPDLVLLDYRLPGMDGVAVIKALQDTPACSGVPIIMITIVDDMDVRYRALDAGATDFLTKPLDLQECEARCRNLLVMREQRLAIERHAAELAAARQRTGRALRIMSRINTLLSGPSTERELLQSICWALAEQAGYPRVCIGLWDSSGVLQEVAANVGPGMDGNSGLLAELNHDGMIDTIRQTGEAWVGNDLNSDRVPEQGAHAAAVAAGYTSMAILPIPLEGLLDGVLVALANQPNTFDHDELELLTRTAEDLGYGIGTRRTRQARDRAQRNVRYLTHFDRLTGLPNHNQVLERLREATEPGWGIAESGKEFETAVFVLGLDRFKIANDTAGQEAGDQLLLQVSERLQAILDPRDLLARQSGDEFILLTSSRQRNAGGAAPSTDGIVRTAKRIIETISRPFAVAGYEYFITASIGIRRLAADDIDMQAVIRQANTAMHQAKEAGGNTFSFYSGELTDRQTRRLSLEGRLRRALDYDKLCVYYQPIVDLATERIVGVEALVRWPQDNGSVVGPNAFIPLAEETGLIDRLGKQVFSLSCVQMKEWEQLGLTPDISVNLSLHQLLRPKLAEEFVAIIRDTGATAERLQIEVTESAMMTDPGRTERVVCALNEFGMKIALDDFGTGYSSFSRLNQLPISVLKVDKGFVRSIASDSNEQTIVRGMIQLSENLGLKTVGEGIEDAAQLRTLREMGCCFGQGFHFHTPLPAAEARKVLTGDAASDGPSPWKSESC